MRMLGICLALLTPWVFSAPVLAQQGDADPRSATAYCTLDDNLEVSARYNPAVKDEPRNGKVWLPGGYPITLFTSAPLLLNNLAIPVGAYSMYVIPNKKEWTLIVSRNITPGAAYDEKDDVARSPMELGEVQAPPKQVQVSFAHIGPKKCGFRIYYGATGAFADFNEQ